MTSGKEPALQEEKEPEQIWPGSDRGSGAQICGRGSNEGNVPILTTGALFIKYSLAASPRTTGFYMRSGIHSHKQELIQG